MLTRTLRISTRRGLAALDAYCRQSHKEPFRRLAAARQDEVIAALEQGKATGFTWPGAQAFFNTVRTHTMEGMFADPIYGGNKDFAGWRVIGFPGAQLEFTRADMEEIGRAMGGAQVWRQPLPPGAPMAHHEGGTRMGNDPKTSVVNKYGQSWDVPNLFVIGSSTFPTN